MQMAGRYPHSVLRFLLLLEQDGADEAACELPADRIGDIAVTASADTALGRTRTDHDVSQLHGGLRSHGPRHEQLVPLVLSGRVTGPLEALSRQHPAQP